MKTGFFSKTAWNNIKKNYRFFVPRIIAESGLLGVFYIVFTLKSDKRILALKGGDYLQVFMSIGTAVLILLSTIIMFYINSFLMKQRKREFGLYNILGMEKRHIGKIMFFETFISSVSSILIGLIFGMLFYKLCSLLICKLLGTDIILGFYFIKPLNIVSAAVFFLILDLLTFIFNRISIAKLKPVDLLASKSSGEKEPKVKIIMLILGVLALAGGYYISLTTKNPLSALLLFFIAVILVIVGTYFLFVTGSIFVLKVLKKNKKYYYTKNHMPAVSGLLYRMKQNAVGLASICILATGVLVMVSTTVSLYSSIEDILAKNYPQHYYVGTVSYDSDDNEYPLPIEDIKAIITDSANKNGIKIKSVAKQKYIDISYNYADKVMNTDKGTLNISDNLEGISSFTFITEDCYKELGGKAIGLKDSEVAICPLDITNDFKDKTFTIANKKMTVVKRLYSFPISSRLVSAVNCYGRVVAKDSVLNDIYLDQKNAYKENASEFESRLAVTFSDIDKACKVGDKLDKAVLEGISSYIEDNSDINAMIPGTDAYWDARDSVFGMYGTLLFLGILLGFVCLFATALVIYYKQISEGYDDRERFQIMQKVGMSKKEVKKTINSQILLVFFLPLIVAGIHLLFAFPILDKLLKVLMLPNTAIFIICAIITYIAFALVYVIIYSATAKTYYRIVK